mmetsp:Transcript_24893/g.58412  ORF Transcript_24893/g.58412 Transcript_24893/m.58412 type:complete len:87 (+) Transcript_24893:1654-1914(+)
MSAVFPTWFECVSANKYRKYPPTKETKPTVFNVKRFSTSMKYARQQKQTMTDIIPPRFLKQASRLFGRTIPLKKSVSWYSRRLKNT